MIKTINLTNRTIELKGNTANKQKFDLPFSKINYLENRNTAMRVFDADGFNYHFPHTTNAFFNEIQDYAFMFIYKRTLVNLHRVENKLPFTLTVVTFKGGKTREVSKRKQEELQQICDAFDFNSWAELVDYLLTLPFGNSIKN